MEVKAREEMENKSNFAVNHSLGLQDLYKAALGEEFSLKQDGEENVLYSLKQLPFTNENSETFNTTTPIITYDAYNNDTNSVLDLDKGIQVQVVKLTNDYHTFSCDTRLLQRYFHDESLITSETTDISNPSSESIAYITKSSLYEDGENVGILPENIGLKYEDCDFNSSDSFASTESIIPKTIQCPKCPKKFMFKSDLTKHTKYKHSSKPKLSCNVCGKEFPSLQNLYFHHKTHNSNKSRANTVCNICEKLYKKPSYLEKHMLEKHAHSLPFACPACGKTFASENVLVTHCKKDHIPPIDKPYQCPTCFKCFEKRQGFSSHLKTHSDVSRHVCDICQKDFPRRSYLKNHMKTHSNQSGPVCEVCGKDFPSIEAVEEHKKCHVADQLLRCEHCFKTFRSKSNFTVHLRTHQENKTFPCSSCNETFTSAAERTKHAKIHKKGDSAFRCNICLQDFSTKKGLSNHENKIHSITKVKTQETCTQTGEELISLSNVNLVVNPANVPGTQSIVLTPITGDFNAVPFIITHPQSATIPYNSVS